MRLVPSTRPAHTRRPRCEHGSPVKRPEGFDRPDGAEPTAGTNAGKNATPQKPDAKPARSKRERPAREARATRISESERAEYTARQVQAEKRAAERAERHAERVEARRFTRDSRRRRITWITVGALFVVLVTVLAVAIFSPILALRTIRIEGASVVKASAVRASLADQLGTPLALLNTTKIDKDLSQFTLIRSYVTEIVPPNTLVVRIEERQAIGVVADGDIFEQVDPAGVVLRKSATRDRLPIIDIGSAKVGGAAFVAAVKVLLAMPSSVASQVQSVSATTLDNVSLTLTGGKHTVIWGSSAQSEEKAEVLGVLLNTPRCKALPVLNVAAPSVVSCGRGAPTPTPTPTGTPTPGNTATPPANGG
jgi:cell division protein FtsQ